MRTLCKKFIVICLAAVVCLASVACGGDPFSKDKDLEKIKKAIAVEYEDEADREAYPFTVTRFNDYINLSMSIFADGIVLDAKFYGGDIAGVISETIGGLIALDKSVSLSKPSSELSRFNAAPKDVKTEISALCYDLLAAARSAYLETDGAFNPAVSPLSKLWHVDIEGIEKYRPDIFLPVIYPETLPSPDDAASVRALTDMNMIELSEQDGKYYVLKKLDGMALDLGGIAKGFAVDFIKQICLKRSVVSANINLSGNLYFVGKMYVDGAFRDWPIGVANPRPLLVEDIFAGRGYVCAFTCGGDVSIVTSGDYERYYFYSYDKDENYIAVPHIVDSAGGFPYSLFYDEETGRYRNSGEQVISCTVVAPSSMLADAYATAVCVKGIEKGAEFLKSEGMSGVIFALGGGGKGRMITVGNVSFFETDTYDEYKDYTDLGAGA